MKQLFRPLQYLWKYFFFLNFALTFLVLFPFFYILLRREKWFPYVRKFKWLWGNMIVLNAGIFYSIKIEKKLNKKETYIFAANHTSYLDVVLAYVVIPGYFHTMAKAELAKIPLFGIFFKRMNIPVNRSSIRDSGRAFLRASSDIDKGISILIYPEGTIHPYAPRLGRFKNGPFKLAIEKQLAVVPISFLNNWKILPDGKNDKGLIGRPGIARVVIHEPIPTKGMNENDVEALSKQVHDIIEATLKKYHESNT